MAALSAGLLLEIPFARAESATRFFPEIDDFFNLDDRMRLMLMAADRFTEETNKKGGNTESRTKEVGANLDYTLMPLLRRATPVKQADD